MHQISEMADRELNEQSRIIGDATKRLQQAQKDFDEAWETVFSTLDEFGLAEQEGRFIASDGFYLHRQMRSATSKLDEEAIKKAIFDHIDEPLATKMWESITVRRIDPEALQSAILKGVFGDWIEDHLPEIKAVPARVRREWTKKDYELAKIYNIQMEAEI